MTEQTNFDPIQKMLKKSQESIKKQKDTMDALKFASIAIQSAMPFIGRFVDRSKLSEAVNKIENVLGDYE